MSHNQAIASSAIISWIANPKGSSPSGLMDLNFLEAKRHPHTLAISECRQTGHWDLEIRGMCCSRMRSLSLMRHSRC